MADTITISNGVIQIIPNAAGISSFDITTYFAGGVELTGVNFTGSAGTDVIKIRDKAAAGTFLVSKLGNDDSMSFVPPLRCFPYILSTDCTLGTPANCVISLYYR